MSNFICPSGFMSRGDRLEGIVLEDMSRGNMSLG